MSSSAPVGLVAAPTPLEPAPRLAAAIGHEPGRLWIKREDLIGIGAGGNKARKLQYTAADALHRGATTLITSEAAQSNHARMTAAVGARLGLHVVLALVGRPGPVPTGNLVLDAMFGARVVWAGEVDDAGLGARVAEEAGRETARGEKVYTVPFGGSSALSARGYLDAAGEIADRRPDVRHVVVAVGSGGTMAGLVRGLGRDHVLGIDTGAVPDPAAAVGRLLDDLGDDDTAGLRLDHDQIGAGYAHLDPCTEEALVLTARAESLVRDPVYTGRAMAGLIAATRAGRIRPDEETVFVHTGGLPGLFGHAEAASWLGRMPSTE